MVPRVLELCEIHKVKPSQVIFEITEQDVASSLELGRKNIEKLNASGFQLSIDDFGTGNSSLLRLRQFPFTELKIDQQFIRGLPEDTESKAIVEATISMARALNLQVMVEGVETQKQAGFLLGLGCTKAQGYHFDRPAPAREFECNWL
jgi:EAL domain-containing protein (putative c-di-GMP-specific phosphodiesterase class I)